MNEKSMRILEYDKIIYQLAEACVSELGHAYALTTKPLRDKEAILLAQEETQEALNVRIKRGSPPLCALYELKDKIKRAEIGATLSQGDLLKVAKNLNGARRMKGYMRHGDEDRENRYPYLESHIEKLTANKSLEEDIDMAILNEEEMADDASPKLRSLRRGMQQKQDHIRQKLDAMVKSPAYEKYLQEGLVTMRGGRYVLPVKQGYKRQIPGMVHDQSASGATLFVEPMAVVQLNNELRALEVEEKKEIERILQAFSQRVAEIGPQIVENQDVLKNLDFIFAKGKLALEMEAFKPQMNETGTLYLKGARHPLIAKNQVVANDIFLGKDFNALVITGPNTGGKTVTLKTIGLLCMLSQAGLHIPCKEGSTVPIYREIFADIGDEQSIEQSLSTFSSHMTNIVHILSAVRPGDLVLFDELGAGTDPTEGAALAMAILTRLHKMGVHTVSTTHYAELKVFALNTEGVKNASVEFDVDSLRPSYRLIIGLPGKSNAFEISQKLGLQEAVIESAQRFIGHKDNRFEDVLAGLEADRKESEQKLLAIEEAYREMKKKEEKLLEKEARFEAQREKKMTEAKKEARELVKRSKREIELLEEKIRKLHVHLGKEENKTIQGAKDELNQALSQFDTGHEGIQKAKAKKSIQNIQVGETVRVLSLNSEGIVLSLPNDSGQVQVQVGLMKMYLGLNEMERIHEKKKNERAAGGFQKNTKTISLEVDVRGKSLEEAIYIVDKYIDDLYINGFSQATIIHGKGSGVLRDGLKDFLKKHKHVKNHRFGEYGEGDAGVSVVTLRG